MQAMRSRAGRRKRIEETNRELVEVDIVHCCACAMDAMKLLRP
jgi:hypothetical protein